MSNSEDPFRINISEEDLKNEPGKDPWAEAFSEFEEWEKKAAEVSEDAKQPIPKAQESDQPNPAEKPKTEEQGHEKKAPAKPQDPNRPMSRYEELCKTPSIKMDTGDVNVMTEFSNIIGKVNGVVKTLETLKAKHPESVPDRFLNNWVNNVKETQTVMLREFQQMQHGRVEKKYDPRCICKECHSVFLEPIPGGICDECRAASEPRSTD